MRRGNDSGLLFDGSTFVGVNLGADFTSEHECGIKDIRQAFGMPDPDDSSIVGLPRRTVTRSPDSVFFDERGDEAWLVAGVTVWGKTDEEKLARAREFYMQDRGELMLHGGYRGRDKDTLATAWDEKSFGIHVRGKENIAHLKTLRDALAKNDAAIWRGGGHVFQNAGLVVAIASRVPAEGAKKMKDADEDYIKLKKAAAKTGIADRLKKAGKRYYALSPRWADLISTRDGDVKTAHKVMFWLNPMEQEIHNAGWFTVEQLDEWAQNKGPVMGGRRARRA